MKSSFRFAVALVFALASNVTVGRGVAEAACGSIPNVFTNGVSAVSATTTNANNSFLVGCATSVDNTQIGSAGIYASQIIPTTVGQATFGGTTVGYSFGGYPSGVVPLTIYGVTSQSVDILDVLLTNGGTNVFKIGSTGVVTFSVASNVFSNATPLTFSSTTGTTITNNATGAVASWTLNSNNGSAPTGDLLDLQLGGTTKFSVLNSGVLKAPDSGTSTLGTLAPCYVPAGTACGTTLHKTLTTTHLSANASCLKNTTCQSSTVTLTAPAAFTSGTSYSCSVSDTSILAGYTIGVTAQTGTTYLVYLANVTEATTSSPADDIQTVCTGT